MSPSPPPTVFVNGRLLTMIPGHPPAEALVVEGDRITAVGGPELRHAHPGADVRDLAGATLCPGFIDAHHHLSIAALEPRWADARGVGSSDELAELLRAQAAAEPEVPWIRATAWNDLGTGFVPHRRDLDALELGRPVLVAHYSLHQGVADSAGLEELGLGRHSPDPPGGELGRDGDGELNGLLKERAWSEAHRRSLAPYDDPARWADHIEVEARRLLTLGITAVHDTACAPEAELAYDLLAGEGRLPVSVLACPHPAALLAPLAHDRLSGPPTGEGNELFRIGPIKLFADGGVEPAIEGHLGGTRFAFGSLFEGLDEEVDAVVAAGFRVAVHALGNVGLEAALGAFEKAAARHRNGDHRFRVEHACLASRPQLERLAGLGGVAVVQPGFLDHLGGQVEGLAFEDAAWLPFGDLARAGVTMAASSDCPCTFDAPVRTSSHGATRRTSTGHVLDPGQAVDFEEWLAAYTAGAAYAGGQEHERGSLAPGRRADLVVLEGRLEGEHPPSVREVWVGGRLVHADPGSIPPTP